MLHSYLNMCRKAEKTTTSLGVLSERTAQAHHWLVAELESVSLPQAVHTLGVDTPLEPEGWAVVSGHLIPHCLLKGELWKCLMTVNIN